MQAVASDYEGGSGPDSRSHPAYLKRVDDRRDSETLSPWTVLVVDDEKDIHRLVHLIADSLEFRGSPVRIVDAYSAGEAREMLASMEISVVLLDVVMETDSAGLDLVGHMRTELHNQATPIVVFTGQPGFAPQQQVVNDYDINGYLSKADVSSQQLRSMLVTSLRVYADYRTIQALARNQQNMAATLKDQNAELERVNGELREEALKNALLKEELGSQDHRADELLRRRLSDMALEKERAELANQAKSEFIASMNHELRNPLHTILGYADMLLLESNPAPTEVRSAVGEIRNAGRHMLTIIEDILELSRVESGAHRVAIEPVSPASIADGCFGLMEQMAAERGVDLVNLIGADAPLVLGSERTIKQVLINLISNAIKYTPAGGRIEVACQPVSDALEISVKDNGIGIPVELQSRIFQPFDRLASNDRGAPGSGIGLYISQRLIRELNSELSFTSTEGLGSRFYFRLPISR